MVDGVVVVVVVAAVVVLVMIVVGIVVLSVVVVVGAMVVKRVDRVVAVVVVKFGSIDTVVDGVVEGVAQVLVDVDAGTVTASAIVLAVVRITRPRAVTIVLPMFDAIVVDLSKTLRGASRNCAMSRGWVPIMAPAFRKECALRLSANVKRHFDDNMSSIRLMEQIHT